MKKKHFCRNCKAKRNHKILHEFLRHGEMDDGYIQWSDEYYIIQCLGCDTISFLKVYGDTEMIGYDDEDEPGYLFDMKIYPPYIEIGNEIDNLNSVPETIRVIYQETISAFKAKCNILTAAGLRAIIEAICKDLKIDKGNLEVKINALSQNSHLSVNESNRLHYIRFFGNDALHEIEKPSQKHLAILLDIINHLLSNLYINETRIKENFETLVESFDDFLKLIENKVYNIDKGKKLTLHEILGKSMRLIPKEQYHNFIEKLNNEIKNNNLTFLKLERMKNENDKYEIIEKPILRLPY